MSERYVTRKELLNEVGWGVLVSFTFLVLMLLALFATSQFEDRELRAFVGSQYAFNESECVRGRGQYEIASCDYVKEITRGTSYGIECATDCSDWKCKVPFSSCDLYCRTEKRQVGEECNETGKVLVRCIGMPEGKYETILNCDRCSCESEVVCTPIFENVSTNCVSGDIVRQARKLMGD